LTAPIRRAIGGAVSSNSNPPPPRLRRRGARRQYDAAALEAAAFRYLVRYASSVENLRRILARKTEDRIAVEAAIAKCVRLGLVDDRSYAAGRSASLARAGASRRAIAERLRAKGVDGETIRDALEGAASDLAAACALVRRRRLGPYRPEAQRAAFREKDLASLARAGFPLDVAREVLACRGPEEVEALTRS
jgi:regulatory protein